MLLKEDLFPSNFNYVKYSKESLLTSQVFKKWEIDKEDFSKKIYDPSFSVQRENNVPFAPELDDLVRLHFLIKSRKVTTVLEYGLGYSSCIFSHALSQNEETLDLNHLKIRRNNIFQCHSLDNNKFWIDQCKKQFLDLSLNKKNLFFHYSELNTSTFLDRVCTFYAETPNICPDLIYLDGPDIYSPHGNIRGISTCHPDRVPMAADILSFEHFLLPGTLIVIDGRTANARFLKSNFQRKWAYLHVPEWDQSFFELQEEPIGIYNKNYIDFALGNSFYKRSG